MSFTESLLYTAGQIFGAKQSGPETTLSSVDDMLAFAKMVNG
ncbi:hypothetical protein PUR29_36665 [Methylobacterium ajmalii]|uniref:Uncharacterized protein n=1 Tax=Methylobacterium ajmalii TaxID=2738439 RepID=A0ABV0A565_9HYPH